jgi:hypothetical protein
VGTDLEVVVTGLSEGVEYDFTGTEINAVGESVASSVVTATPTAAAYDILTTPGLYFYLDMNDAGSITTSGSDVTDIQDQHTTNVDFQPDAVGTRPQVGVTVGSLDAFDFTGGQNIRKAGFGTPSDLATHHAD